MSVHVGRSSGRRRKSLVLVVLAATFLLSACSTDPSTREGNALAEDDPSVQAVNTVTEDESLVRTRWQVVEITSPDGVTHLPYGGAPGPLESPPVVEYDFYGHVASVFDGESGYRAEHTSNTIESLLPIVGEKRAAFSVGSTLVLLYGVPERNGSSLTLTWNGYTARLQLMSEDRYNPPSTAPGS